MISWAGTGPVSSSEMGSPGVASIRKVRKGQQDRSISTNLASSVTRPETASKLRRTPSRETRLDREGGPAGLLSRIGLRVFRVLEPVKQS
jgi:hypothetical protein